MRRQVKRMAVCVVVGVVVNVLVAWGCALWVLPTPVEVRLLEHSARWAISVPANWPLPSTQMAEAGAGKRWLLTVGTGETVGECSIHEVWSGWPMMAMQRVTAMSERDAAGTQRGLSPGRWGGGIDVPLWMAREDDWEAWGVPLRPVWPGFAVNTLVYGAVAWGVLFAPGVVKRWRRRRRGACVGCGYELAGLVRCPECGNEKKRGVKARPSPVTQSRDILSHAQSRTGEGALSADAKPSSTLPGRE